MTRHLVLAGVVALSASCTVQSSPPPQYPDPQYTEPPPERTTDGSRPRRPRGHDHDHQQPGQHPHEPPAPSRPTTPPPGPVPSRPTPPVWDSQGWIRVGAETISGAGGKTMVVRPSQRQQFNALTIVAMDGSFEMDDVVVTFDNGRKYSPKVRQSFREGQRTRALDLPGEARAITEINLTYRDLSGNARVEVWGRAGAPPDTRPVQPNWDTRGWVYLGQEAAENTNDKDAIQVNDGRTYDSIAFWAVDEVAVGKVVVTFANNRTWAPNFKRTFRGGELRTAELPAGGRALKRVDIEYSRPEGAGNSRVQIWVRPVGVATAPAPGQPAPAPGQPAPPPAPVPAPGGWSSAGWTFLGDATIDTSNTKVMINVGRDTVYKQLTFVVSEGEAHVEDAVVTFVNNRAFSPKVTQHFKEGARARTVDLPAGGRALKQVEIRYANRGAGNARIQVWAR